MRPSFPDIVPWLMLNRRGLTVFVHPETGDNLADHRDLRGVDGQDAAPEPRSLRRRVSRAEPLAAPPPLWILLPAGQRTSGKWIDDTLRERASEAGLLDKVPLAARFPRQRVEVVRGPDPEAEVNRRFYLRGWTDGLPVVPPTLGRVEEALSWAPAADADPDTVLGELDPLKGLATVEKVAVNATMAGCRPEHLPVVIAAVRALADPAFNLRGVQTTDENVTPLIVVCGPVARAIGMNASFGALGPGWQANAAIGRAVRLVMNNIGGGWPAAVSFAGLGQPGRYTLCLAERAERSPWPPAPRRARLRRGGERGRGPAGGERHQRDRRPSTTSRASWARRHPASPCCMEASRRSRSPPFVAKELAEEGFGKDDVKRRLWQDGRMTAAAWRRTWLHERLIGARQWPECVREAEEHEGAIPAVASPEDLVVLVAGGDIPIPQCAYFPSLGVPALPRLAPRRASRRTGTPASPAPGDRSPAPAPLLSSRAPAALTTDIRHITVRHDPTLQKQGAQEVHGARRRAPYPRRAQRDRARYPHSPQRLLHAGGHGPARLQAAPPQRSLLRVLGP